MQTKKREFSSPSKESSSSIKSLSQQRKKELSSKFGFSITELRTYEQVCERMRKLSVAGKTDILATLLKNASI